MLLALVLACAHPHADDTAPGGADDSAGGDDSGGGDEAGPPPLDAPSSGACPDLSAPGTSTFLSSGEERKVTVVWPDDLPADAPVVFFFHGLMDASGPGSPGADTVDMLGIEAVAAETGSVWVVPDAPVVDLFGYRFYLWDIARETDHDLVLVDDLRTCVAEALDVDLSRMVAMGFSGGGLFTTVVLSDRGDRLAAAVAMSGGADVDIPIWEALASEYRTPAEDFPVLMVTGGETDVWPDPSLVVVDFEAATDTLQAKLAADGHLAVRCHHDRGHTVTNAEWTFALDWAFAHRFGEPSPWADGDLGGEADWCGYVE